MTSHGHLFVRFWWFFAAKYLAVLALYISACILIYIYYNNNILINCIHVYYIYTYSCTYIMYLFFSFHHVGLKDATWESSDAAEPNQILMYIGII